MNTDGDVIIVIFMDLFTRKYVYVYSELPLIVIVYLDDYTANKLNLNLKSDF